MTQDKDVLSKFKLISDSMKKSDKSPKVDADQAFYADIYSGFYNDAGVKASEFFNGFLQGSDANVYSEDLKDTNLKDDLLNDLMTNKAASNSNEKLMQGQVKDQKQVNNVVSFLKKLFGEEKESQSETNIEDHSSKNQGSVRQIHKSSHKESEKMNYVQKSMKMLFEKTQTKLSNEASKFYNDEKRLSKKDNKVEPASKSKENVDPITGELKQQVPRENLLKVDNNLIEKVAKISINYNTDNMEDIIKSPELTKTDLQKLFINYVSKSVEESTNYANVLDKLLTHNVAKGDINRAELEKIFINYINETENNPSVVPLSENERLIQKYEVAINPENMSREALTDLVIRFTNELASKDQDAFKRFMQVYSDNTGINLNDIDINSLSAVETAKLLRVAIKPDYISRDQLSNIFVEFMKDVANDTPELWEQVQSKLNKAVFTSVAQEVTMDDQAKNAITNFRMAITSDALSREDLEELFLRFSREISNKYPAAWAELETVLSNALPNAFKPDLTMDDKSRLALLGFAQVIKPDYMTREDLIELFLRFSREISINFPAAWSELENILNNALPNAFKADTTMDDNSRAVIVTFAQALKPEFMTREVLEELFLRFSREISVKYPAAWSEMENMLSVAIVNAFAPDITMDDSSKFALVGFAQALKPESMTRDEMVELFVRFSREISVKFPAAWAELQTVLQNAMPSAMVIDNTMDDSSRSAISGFAQAIKPEFMTRDDLVELFVRFSREVSVKFPAAWAELQGMLQNALPSAFVVDTTMDDSSRSAIAGFVNALKPEVMTRETMEELFLRFAREVSIKFPAAWAELEKMLSNSVAHAFVPNTTIDAKSENLVNEFATILHTQSLGEKKLEGIMGEYLKEVPLQFTAAKSLIENIADSKRKVASSKDRQMNEMNKNYENIEKEFKKVSMDSSMLDVLAQDISKDLKGAETKEVIDDKIQQLLKIELEKNKLDANYTGTISSINANVKASHNIQDDYTQKLNISFDKKDDRELFEINTKELTDWDMVRMLRREEVLNIMDEIPQEDLAECLYVVPKHILKQALTQLPIEDMCRVLFNARFPEALLRSMPRNTAIEQLPPAEEMIPIIMTMGNIAGYKNGCDLLEDIIVKGMKVEGQQNETRTQEELLPFIMEQLIGKTPRNADAVRPVLGKVSPVKKAMNAFKADQINIDRAMKVQGQQEQDNIKKLKYDSPEFMKPVELKQLSQDNVDKMGSEDLTNTLAAKRGSPEEIMQFLECLHKVKDLASARMAVSVLTVNQTNTIAKAIIPTLTTQQLVKVSQYYSAKSNEEMVKAMPRYAITGMIKSLPKHFMIQGFKLLDKSMITGMLKTQSSQTIARVACEMLSHDTIKENAFKKQGFVY